MTKYTAIIQTLSTFGKAHKNAINGVPNRKINSRPTKKVHLTNFRATNVKHVPCTAAKDHLGSFGAGSYVLTKRKTVTTFAAKERIRKENVVFLTRSFCFFFVRLKKKIPTPLCGKSDSAAAQGCYCAGCFTVTMTCPLLSPERT